MEEELCIFNLREDINKLKAAISVILSVLDSDNNLNDEIDKLHIFKKTIWEESDDHHMQMKASEENYLKTQLEAYDKLFMHNLIVPLNFSHLETEMPSSKVNPPFARSRLDELCQNIESLTKRVHAID